MTSAESCASSAERPAPNAMLPGIWVAGAKEARDERAALLVDEICSGRGAAEPVTPPGARWTGRPPGGVADVVVGVEPAQHYGSRVGDPPGGTSRSPGRACRRSRDAGRRPWPRRSRRRRADRPPRRRRAGRSSAAASRAGSGRSTRPRYGASPERPASPAVAAVARTRRHHRGQGDDHEPERCPGAAGGC